MLINRQNNLAVAANMLRQFPSRGELGDHFPGLESALLEIALVMESDWTVVEFYFIMLTSRLNLVLCGTVANN